GGAPDGPPATRLLRLMAPLYDGPVPIVAREFPSSRRARMAVAIWVCGALRRRFGWPRSFVERPLAWLSQVAPVADAFLPLDQLVLGLWELTPRVHAQCDLNAYEGRAALLEWFANRAIAEFALE